jgi:hypothetical protein
MDSKISEMRMSATNWIALGGLLVTALTFYFSFCNKPNDNKTNPTTVIEFKPTMTQNLNTREDNIKNSGNNRVLSTSKPLIPSESPKALTPIKDNGHFINNSKEKSNSDAENPVVVVEKKEIKPPRAVTVYEDNNVLIVFKDCRRQGSGLQIRLNLTAIDNDRHISISGNNNGTGSTKMFGNNGKEYLLSTMKPETAIGNNGLTLVRDMPTDIFLKFQEVDESINIVTLLELPFEISGTSGYPVAKFRNLEVK